MLLSSANLSSISATGLSITLFYGTKAEISIMKLPFSHSLAYSLKLFFNFFARNFWEVNNSLRFYFLIFDCLCFWKKRDWSLPISPSEYTNLAMTLRQAEHAKWPLRSLCISIYSGYLQQLAVGY